jgi:FkbM family methyltransferase
MNTYITNYGNVTLYNNDDGIGYSFQRGIYWDEETLIKLKQHINPNRNILEIGGHCGTSTLVYSSFLSNNNKVFVYEPQKYLYKLLVNNINQNNLQDKIIPHNSGVFCYNGIGKMNDTTLDIETNNNGIVLNRYTTEQHIYCNFGGVPLGNGGEEINLTTIDDMNIEDIGYIHCDAQGSENFIFSKGTNTIKKCRPLILYENKELYGNHFYDNICKSYSEYKEESIFDIKIYCMDILGYSKYIDKFNNGIDTLLIP